MTSAPRTHARSTLGQGTENPLVDAGRGTKRAALSPSTDDQPINALYSSTCGGRTENAENIFDEKLPYLVSTMCEYKHPEPIPFTSSRSFPDWKDAVLTVAGVSNFTEARRFMGLPGQGEPPSMDAAALAPFIRQIVLSDGFDHVRCLVRDRAGHPAAVGTVSCTKRFCFGSSTRRALLNGSRAC